MPMSDDDVVEGRPELMIIYFQWLSAQRRFDRSPVPSAILERFIDSNPHFG